MRAARGDWQGSTRSALDILRLTYDTPRGGPLICALFASALQELSTDQLLLILPHLDSATCRMAAREMENLYARRVPYWETLQEEKWAGQAGLLELMRQPHWTSSIMQAIGYKGAAQRPLFVLMSKRALMNSYTAFMDTMIANARLPYAKSSSQRPPANDFYSAMIAPTYFSLRCTFAKHEASAAMLTVALALRAYKIEHGLYPNALLQLVPNYLQSVPADPFGGGEALRYKKQQSTCVLWSIGSDKKDDGGKAVDNPGKTGRFLMQDDSKGDYVFGVNR